MGPAIMRNVPVVTTIQDKCKRCYSCVRNCPAKAIKVSGGQAEVIPERCIACGHCVRVCSQNAKQIRDDVKPVLKLLHAKRPVFAIIAPSFPAAFPNDDPGKIIAGLKKAGFAAVFEVALGADMVSQEYRKLYDKQIMPLMISSPCPAVVNYIEKYYPELNLCLAPIVSPMIAIARYIKLVHGTDNHIVFVGPCIAKKKEMHDRNVAGVVDAVLTFEEMKQLFQLLCIVPSELSPTNFYGPKASWGQLFPVSGGLLKSAEMNADITVSDLITTEGKDRVLEIVVKASQGEIEAKFLDLLFCEGCINGPKMDNSLSVFVKKDKIINFVKQRNPDRTLLNTSINVDLRRRFSNDYQVVASPSREDIRSILLRTGKKSPRDELNCGACGYASCREKAIAVYQGLAEAEMCLPYMVDKLEQMQAELRANNAELSASLDTLKKTQEQLTRSEKLASIGQLAAGVAHELNNPLGGIMIFTGLLLESLKQTDPAADDLRRILHETERCRNIVKGLLDFSRQSNMQAAIVDLNAIINSTLSLVEHQTLFQNIQIIKKLAPNLDKIFADVGQIQQICLNVIMNAAEAMDGHGKLTVQTSMSHDKQFVQAVFADTGPGMAPGVQRRIFDPFYTTKPPGKGTGLGLAITYGIVQRHKGEINVSSTPGHGASFTIRLPNSIRFHELENLGSEIIIPENQFAKH